MNLTPYYEKQLFARTLDDEARFAAATEHLPIREDDTPYHSGPHSLRSMRIAKQLTSAWNVLEVGFCLGHSASIWFSLGVERVTSIERSSREQTMRAGKIMRDRHGDRFHLLITTSDKLMGWEPIYPFELMFIDGGHDFDDVSKDIALGLKLKIPYFLLDDWFPKWGPGVQLAIEYHRLVPIALLGNMALCAPGTGWKTQ